MIFRKTAYATVLVAGVLAAVSVSRAAPCEGAGCRATAPAKPLDIMQFMREQAASTRVAKPRQSPARTALKVHRVPQRTIAARRKPARVPVEAAASFASRPAQDIQVQASDQYNAIDRTADTAPAETTGAGLPDGPLVQLVDAGEFNDIDRKADSAPLLATAASRPNDIPQPSEQASPSWLQWIWSALGGTLAALAAAVRQLVHL
jgi:hypothetical protein